MSQPTAWINDRGVIYRFPTSKTGLRPLVYGDTEETQNSERYKAFRTDILTKAQPVMSEVANILCGPVNLTTPEMVDAAFDVAMKRFR